MLEFGTRDGHLIEWCSTCDERERKAAVFARYSIQGTIQQHKATGFCTHVERYQVCRLPQAAGSSKNDCDRYCVEHCRFHENEHECRRSWKRRYMRGYMRDYSARVRAQCSRLYQKGDEN